MRESYHESLDEVVADLVQMADDIAVAVRDCTKALLEGDLQAAEQVISNDEKIDAKHDDIENRCFILLARQAPVAGELRTIVAALRMVTDLGRMGDLAAHVAKIARLRYPTKAVPEPLTENFKRMAELAENMVIEAGQTLHNKDVNVASALAQNDEEIDELRREQFKVVLGDDWNHGVAAAVDVALLGRYYERISDHAVAMGRRLIYLVTGETPEGEDWPTT